MTELNINELILDNIEIKIGDIIFNYLNLLSIDDIIELNKCESIIKKFKEYIDIDINLFNYNKTLLILTLIKILSEMNISLNILDIQEDEIKLNKYIKIINDLSYCINQMIELKYNNYDINIFEENINLFLDNLSDESKKSSTFIFSPIKSEDELEDFSKIYNIELTDDDSESEKKFLIKKRREIKEKFLCKKNKLQYNNSSLNNNNLKINYKKSIIFI